MNYKKNERIKGDSVEREGYAAAECVLRDQRIVHKIVKNTRLERTNCAINQHHYKEFSKRLRDKHSDDAQQKWWDTVIR